MKVKIQVVTITDDGQETITDIACVERHDLTPETFGLSLAEGKAVLQALQEVVVEWQLHTYLQQQHTCPHCGQTRLSKGVHHTVFRTVFGTLPVESPRLYHCGCQAHATMSFSPLATLLPERTTPDLLYLETKWAALPMPAGPLTVGIDGGYVKAQGEQGGFEVIAGKSLLAFHRGEEAQVPVSSKCFAFVQTYDQHPKRRLFEVLQSQGHQLNQQVTFLSDGGDTVRDLQLYLNPQAEHLLDWFHVTMR